MRTNEINFNDKEFNDIMLKHTLALEMLETEIRIMIKNFEYTNDRYPVDHIKSRIKSKESIIKKLERKNYKVTPNNIVNHVHDIIGIRIVCSFINDVYDIIELIKANTKYTIKEEKDYISNPKYTGYISYHIILEMPVFLDGEEVPIEAEIQVRTTAMDFWASLDHKIGYKLEDMPEELREEMYKCSLDIKELDKKMFKIKKKAEKYKKDN